MITRLIVIVVFLLLSLLQPAVGDSMKGPWTEKKPPDSVKAKKQSQNVLKQNFKAAIWVFQHYISPVDGDRCQMYPSCSQYGAIAFEKYGFVEGYLLTMDRLMRDNFGAEKHYPARLYDGRWLLFDPVEPHVLTKPSAKKKRQLPQEVSGANKNVIR